MGDHEVRTEEDRRVFKILTVTPTEKRPMRRCEDNIRIDFK